MWNAFCFVLVILIITQISSFIFIHIFIACSSMTFIQILMDVLIHIFHFFNIYFSLRNDSNSNFNLWLYNKLLLLHILTNFVLLFVCLNVGSIIFLLVAELCTTKIILVKIKCTRLYFIDPSHTNIKIIGPVKLLNKHCYCSKTKHDTFLLCLFWHHTFNH